MVPLLPEAWPDEELQPMPDSRKMEDLIGSGEFESSRSRRGDLRDAAILERARKKVQVQQTLYVGTISLRASHVMASQSYQGGSINLFGPTRD